MPTYTIEDLRAAIQEYLETDKSQYQIAQEFGIPRSTLNDYIRSLYGYVDEDMSRRARGLSSVKAVLDKSELLASMSSDVSESNRKEKSDRSAALLDMSEGDRKESEGEDKAFAEGENKGSLWLWLLLGAGVIIFIFNCIRNWRERAIEKAHMAAIAAQAPKESPAPSTQPQVQALASYQITDEEIEIEREVAKYNELFRKWGWSPD